MTYDPETYWSARYRKQGARYVAKGGGRDSYSAQVGALAVYLDHLPTSGRVLDFGCGPGRFRALLEDRGLEYEGVDIVPGIGTMEVEDIEPESFDAAVAIYVLQHIVSLIEYRDVVYRLENALKPGGTLLVVDAEPRADADWDEHMRPSGPDHIPMEGEVVGRYDGHWIGVFTK